MSENPIVSVCITAYNVAPYLSEAIEGALMQVTSFPFEIIIGDDGSSDDTRQICLSYQQKYPEKFGLVLHDKNVGVARNDISVVEKARGKYLAWCDGDDYWIDKHKLQKQYEILEVNQDVALVHTDWKNYYEEKGKFTENKKIINEIEESKWGKEGISMLIFRQNPGCRFSSCMFHRSYYLSTLYENPDLFLVGHVCNDLAVFIAMYARGRFYHIPDITLVYRIRKESLSFTYNQERYFQYLLGYFKLIAHTVIYYQLSEKIKNNVFRRTLNGLLLYTFQHKRKQDADDIKKICDTSGYKLTKTRLILYLGSVNRFFNILLIPAFRHKFR